MISLESTLFVVNPAAGGGRSRKIWSSLQDSRPILERSQRIQIEDPSAAMSHLDAYLQSGGISRVVALGGDGTIHSVIHALLSQQSQASVGIIPSGTGSDFARGLALPKSPLKALDRILEQPPKPLDALRLTTDSGQTKHIVNIASTGVSGEVAVAVNAMPRKGSLSYLLATVRALRRFRPSTCRVFVDGELLFDGSFLVVAVANGPFFGNGMQVAPGALQNDGLADVVLVPEIPLYQLPYRLPQFITGRHLKIPFVKHRKAQHIRFEPAPDFPPFELDGEPLPAEPLEIQVLPQALRFHY